jgi:transcriptional regulator with XRE-family HTH domain
MPKPDPQPPTLATRLERLRARSGLTVWQVAGRAQMETKQAWQLFSGQNSNPTLRTLERLVEAMGFTMRDLFADDASEKSKEGG